MKKIIILLTCVASLSSCDVLDPKVEPLVYEKQLNELMEQNVKIECYYVSGDKSSSFNLDISGCNNWDAFINYNNNIIYTKYDSTFRSDSTREILYANNLYRVYDDNKIANKREYVKYNDEFENSVYRNVYEIYTLLAMLDVYNQEVDKVTSYDKDSAHWKEYAQHYNVTMRGDADLDEYEEKMCSLEKINVERTDNNTVIIEAYENGCEDLEGNLINTISKIEVSINVEDEEFNNTYNELVSLVESQ